MKKILAAALIILGASPVSAKDLVIGVAGPVSGPVASFGQQMKRGVDMAVRDINEAGGVLGDKIAPDIADDACDPKQAVTVANKLAAKHVPVVIGHFCSGSSLPASDIYNEEGIIMISPSSTNPQLTETGKKSIFRVVARDDEQGQVAAKFIAEKFKGKNIAIVHDKQTAPKGLAEATRDNLHKLGVKEVLFDTINPGEKDYSAFVTRLKESKIDLLYYPGYPVEAGLIARQIRENGLKTILMGGDAYMTKELWTITGQYGNGILMTYPPDPRRDPKNAALVKRFQKEGFDPEGYTLYTYAALKVWADAANKSKTTDPKKVAEFMKQNSFDTTLGTIGFNEKGDVKGLHFVVYEWRDGNYDYVKP